MSDVKVEVLKDTMLLGGWSVDEIGGVSLVGKKVFAIPEHLELVGVLVKREPQPEGFYAGDLLQRPGGRVYTASTPGRLTTSIMVDFLPVTPPPASETGDGADIRAMIDDLRKKWAHVEPDSPRRLQLEIVNKFNDRLDAIAAQLATAKR